MQIDTIIIKLPKETLELELTHWRAINLCGIVFNVAGALAPMFNKLILFYVGGALAPIVQSIEVQSVDSLPAKAGPTTSEASSFM